MLLLGMSCIKIHHPFLNGETIQLPYLDEYFPDRSRQLRWVPSSKYRPPEFDLNNKITMRPHIESKFAVAGILLAALGALATAVAQDTLVALGRVESTGALSSSQNTVGGLVSAVNNADGDFTVTIDAVGAFAGAAETDFVVELAFASNALDDNIAKSDISVTDDQLTLDVAMVDVEHPTSPSLGFAQSRDFFFLIRRVPGGAAGSRSRRCRESREARPGGTHSAR